MLKIHLIFIALFSIALSGCLKQKIYTDIADKSYISHPPSSLRIMDLSGMVKSGFKNDPSSPFGMEIYLHQAHCSNAQSKSTGTDFDGYIRITVSDHSRMIARAQMDYKGKPDRDSIQKVYVHLMKTLKWR